MTKNEFILQTVISKIGNSNAQILDILFKIKDIITIAKELEKNGVKFDCEPEEFQDIRFESGKKGDTN